MIEFTIPAMTCGHCVRSVTETAQRVDPAARVDIDLERHLVRIESSRPADAFRSALSEEGYEPA